MDRTPVHLIIPTHTPRHLDFVMVGIARQTVAPTTITVTCDVFDDEIEQVLRWAKSDLGLTVRYVRREHSGTERLSQVRNNAVRALLAAGVTDGWLIFLDGDMVPSETFIEQHADRSVGYDLMPGNRINLNEAQTSKLNRDRLVDGSETIEPPQDQLAILNSIHNKAKRHAFLRRFGLTKRHKPKTVGAHHGVRLSVYQRINGYDEEYHTFGTEDDDFMRRCYLSGAKPCIAIRDILAFHLYHPTRGSADWHDRPNARRFKRHDLPIVCVHGLENPIEQTKVLVDVI